MNLIRVYCARSILFIPIKFSVLMLLCVGLFNAMYGLTSATVQVFAYNGDGTNSGTARLTQHLTLGAAIKGTADQNVTWTLQGAGSLSGTTYQAPDTMPANSSVTITAALTATPSVSASYTFTLVNPIPVVYKVVGTFNRATVNPITITGDGFVAGTVVLANGTAVQSTYQSKGSLLAQIPVAANALGSLPITVQNPSPVGGASGVFQAPVAAATVQVFAYNGDGTNSGTARLTQHLTLGAAIKGTADQNVTWTLQGAGSLSGTTYQAPDTMPANSSVTITAALTATPSVSASYTFTLVNPIPVVYKVVGTFNRATVNPITITGDGFVPGTVVLANGTAVQSTYQSKGSLLAQIPVAANALGSLPITVQNPSPVGGASGVFQAPVAAATVQVFAYNGDGTNTGTARLTQHLTLGAAVKGTADQNVTWTLQGAGSLSGTTYQAPDTMPANPSVTITAALTATPSASASYTFALVNPVPVVYKVVGSFNRAMVNPITITGDGFVAGTVVLANGTAVQSTYQSKGSLLAQIPVAANASGSLPITVQNPSPVGGASGVLQASIAAATVQVFAYNGDGTNSGTARLTQHLTLGAAVKGTADQNVTWTLQGAGSLSGTTYQAPDTMPANPSVTITAALTATPSVSASYTFALVNPIPVVYSVVGTLKIAATNAVTINGDGFIPTTSVLVNGTPVQSTYQSRGSLLAQIPVSANASGSLPVSLQNPSPLGGSSTIFPASITLPTVQVFASNALGLNTGKAALGMPMQFVANVTGAVNLGSAYPVKWSLQGPGVITDNGIYNAPASMPSNSVATVTAYLASNSAAFNSYSFSLGNPAPVLNGTLPVQLSIGTPSAMSVSGRGFVPGTTILANGQPVASSYQSDSSISVQIPALAMGTKSVSLIAESPTPGGGQSNPLTVIVSDDLTVSAQVSIQPGQAIPENFVGFSAEWGEAQTLMGSAQNGRNNIYRQLLTNLQLGLSYPLQVRVGGSSTDKTGEPSTGAVQPLADLANDLGVHFTLGVNLGSDNPQLAQDQARFYVNQMPSGTLDAIEIGNEPDGYPITGERQPTYSVQNYIGDFTTWESYLLPVMPSTMRFMGPSWSAVRSSTDEKSFEQIGSNVSLVSQHFYVSSQTNGEIFSPDFLLAPAASTAIAAKIKPFVQLTHANNQLFRMGEVNSINGGGVAGVSNGFASALWAIDVMFELANVGVDGVNWHGLNACNYCEFKFAYSTMGLQTVFSLQQVNPIYYALLFFREVTQNNARLLPVTYTTNSNLKIWAAMGNDGKVRIAVINKDQNFAGHVSIAVPGFGNAEMIQLVAPSFQSLNGLSLGGQTFDGSVDGTALGDSLATEVQQANGIYRVPVQPTSAVLLTLQ